MDEAEPRQLVSERIHRHLLGQILRGELATGEAVPSERALSESFEVNRHAVREAMKRLQQARLVETSQGGSTRVADWRRSAGLDLLSELARDPDPPLVRAVVEARRTIGSDAARGFAERIGLGQAGTADRERLSGFATAPPAEGAAREGRRERYIAMWDAIIEGSGSLPYRLAYNSLLIGSAGPLIEMSEIFEAEESDRTGQLTLIGACLDGERDHALAAGLALLDQAVVGLGGTPLSRS